MTQMQIKHDQQDKVIILLIKVTPSGFVTNVSCNFLVVFGLEAVRNYEDMKVLLASSCLGL